MPPHCLTRVCCLSFDARGAITGCSFSTTRQFYPIRLSEMDNFLRPQGFHQLSLDHSCHEIVYGKELNPKLVMLRVYTRIVGQSSRNSGQDARFVLPCSRTDSGAEVPPRS